MYFWRNGPAVSSATAAAAAAAAAAFQRTPSIGSGQFHHAVMALHWTTGPSCFFSCDAFLSLQRRAGSRLLSKSFSAAVGGDLDSPFLVGDLAPNRSADGRVPNDLAESSGRKEKARSLSAGIPEGFSVVQRYPIPSDRPFHFESLNNLGPRDSSRLELTADNVTLPVALMLFDPETYPSLSRARKACRRGSILILRRRGGSSSTSPSSSLSPRSDTSEEVDGMPDDTGSEDSDLRRGRVDDRVYPGDVLCRQVRMGSGSFPVLSHRKPPFEMPVVYEDDHFAVVNKPAGVVVLGRRGAGHGIMTVRAALPFCVRPPAPGTVAVLRRPEAVHRLDKPTCGLLCVAKTKPAMVDLSRQFHDRIVQKTYVAIVNGIPLQENGVTISAWKANQLGVDVDPTGDLEPWQVIESPLEGKLAVTVWRAIRSVPSLHANDGHLTLVEMKPKTGRFHQLRRHMAWVCRRPLVGDVEYDGGTPDARRFRDRGLFLCSNRLTVEHPYYNSDPGRVAWEKLDEDAKYAGGTIWLSPEGKVMVTATVELPDKFEDLLEQAEGRFNRLSPEQ